ncbi:MAG: hypothetical protein B7X76_04945, partial [Azorhizobium sp. 39-67-5]
MLGDTLVRDVALRLPQLISPPSFHFAFADPSRTPRLGLDCKPARLRRCGAEHTRGTWRGNPSTIFTVGGVFPSLEGSMGIL